MLIFFLRPAGIAKYVKSAAGKITLEAAPVAYYMYHYKKRLLHYVEKDTHHLLTNFAMFIGEHTEL